MKKITLFIIALCFVDFLYSQDCNNGTEHDTSYAAQNNGFIENVSTFIKPGEYMTVTGILENEYIFTASHTESMVFYNDYITITDTSNNILQQSLSPLTYTFISAGTIRMHLYLDDNCTTQDLQLTVTLLNNTVAQTTCQEPENPTVSYRSDTRIDFSWDPPSVGDTPVSYDWEAVPTGNGQGVGVEDSGNVTLTSASATGLASSTSYTFYIRSKCGANGNSDWFATPPLTTNSGPPPANDICNGAILVIEETGVADAASATAIPGTLLNTAATDVDPENCDSGNPDNARDDVWYKFIAQTTDINITLNTFSSLFNGVLSLFSDCDESSYLACSDAGTGSTEEQISYNSLVIGQTYYFRVWNQGFATSSPSFTVKLWSSTATTDNDGDGYSNDPNVDCDDGNNTVYPGAPELCDGLDNDCANGIDDGLTFLNYYTDGDGDGYGDSSDTAENSCSPVSGKVTNNTDCDDSLAAINPDTVWYLDADGDNFAVSTMTQCTSPGLGYTTSVLPTTDCDDGNNTVYPGAPELCDGLDNDCANGIDDGLTFLNYYTDGDGDGYGDSSDTAENSCSPVSGKVTNNTDCDDSLAAINPDTVWYLDADGDNFAVSTMTQCTSPGLGYTTSVLPTTDCDDGNNTVYPGAPELCDGLDNDCANGIDDGLTFLNYYTDGDGDGYGDSSDTAENSCSPVSGKVTNNTDCDDSLAAINPDTVWYLDADGDNFAVSTMTQCTSPGLGYTTSVLPTTDCDDGNNTVYPGAPELCDGLDNDCANGIDDGLTFLNYYTDGDGDGYGDSSDTAENSCSPVSGKVTNNTDCDDSLAAINPDTVWYLDADGDNFAVSTMAQCTSPGLGYTTSVLPTTDCDDGNNTVYPDAPELCDGLDNDCDGDIDDADPDITGQSTWYEDSDGDAYGNPMVSILACSQPIGYVSDNTDCNDGDSAINPGATEIPGNGIDENCDGSDIYIWYADTDLDSYGDPNVSQESNTQPIGYVLDNTDCNDADSAINPDTVWYLDADGDNFAVSTMTQCTSPGLGYTTSVLPTTDCDDGNNTVYPGAPELCDGLDNDCANGIDDGLTFLNYYTDGDGDGYGDSSDTAENSCSPVSGKVTNNTDCDDSLAAINPDTVWYLDADGDNFAVSTMTQCTSPGLGYTTSVLPTTDCDDGNNTVYPGAPELCDGLDNDCANGIDDGLTFLNYYTDGDGDGYGDSSDTAENSCSPVSGKVTNNTDCDDSLAAINPDTVWYLDADGDNFAVSTMTQCTSPGLGYTTSVLPTTDCDDGNNTVYPGAPELCDGLDNDCANGIDDGLTFLNYYTDGDGDGYGDSSDTAENSCSPVSGKVTNNTDCDDSLAAINPDTVWYLDADGDNFAVSTMTQCTSPGLGYTTSVLPTTDCDDGNNTVYPGAPELCDGLDNDCANGIDDGLTFLNYYTDGDGDGYGDSSDTAENSCSPVSGKVTNNTDCDDSLAAINPGATDIPNNGIDEDCDGTDAPIIPEYLNDFSSYPGTGWSEATGVYGSPRGTSSDWTSADYGNDETHINGQSAKINIEGITKDEYLVSPVFDLTTMSYYLNFDIALTAFDDTMATTLGDDDYVALLITENDWNTFYQLKVWDSNSSVSTSRQRADEITLNGYGANVKFAFYAFSDIANTNVDFFIDNFQITSTSLSLNDNSIDEFTIFPNPIKDILNLNALEIINNISVYSLIGQKIISLRPNNLKFQVDMSKLSSGMYIVKVKVGEKLGTYRIIKR